MVQLIERKILSIQDQKGQLLCLDYFQEQGEQEHKRIIEDIKCILDWPNLIKEELVQHYIEFSQHLHQNTFGIIPIAQDPDRLHASQKVVNYDDFTRFVQFLSERDALIAKLLYFGGPTVEEVLFLKYGQLDFDNCSVNFSKQSVSYPKHLILELSNFAGKKKKNALVFLNYKGKQVVRTHLNHSFGRASKEINLMITPRELTKIKLK
jgi:integrase